MYNYHRHTLTLPANYLLLVQFLPQLNEIDKVQQIFALLFIKVNYMKFF